MVNLYTFFFQTSTRNKYRTEKYALDSKQKALDKS